MHRGRFQSLSTLFRPVIGDIFLRKMPRNSLAFGTLQLWNGYRALPRTLNLGMVCADSPLVPRDGHRPHYAARWLRPLDASARFCLPEWLEMDALPGKSDDRSIPPFSSAPRPAALVRARVSREGRKELAYRESALLCMGQNRSYRLMRSQSVGTHPFVSASSPAWINAQSAQLNGKPLRSKAARPKMRQP